MNILEVKDVSKSYGSFHALRNVSLDIPDGCIFGLLGPNGAGKTTLIRIINQIMAPDSGSIVFRGNPLRRDHIRDIGYLPEERGLYKKMKVGEQAIYLAMLKGMDRKTAVKELREWFGKFELTPWWDKKIEDLSKGMAQKVQFITTIIHKPRLLILDEPFSGFDPINAELVKDEILKMRNEGVTIVLSTHNMSSVEQICERIALLNHSEKILEGTVTELRKAFFTHTYSLQVSSFNAGCIDKDSWKEKFDLQALQESDGRHRLRVQIRNGHSLNELVSSILPHGELHEVAEEIPTMHDIFIQQVKGSNHG